MKIAVLGSSGGMGSYFVRRFLEDGHSVTGHDAGKVKPPGGLISAASNSEAVRGADVVLISVPIRDTGKVGREVVPHIRDGAVLVEIASLKTGVRKELTKALKGRRVTLVSMHPMFGPHSTSADPKILILGGARELAFGESLFPWARLIRVNEADHDRIMAYSLNLVHLLNLAFASSLAKGIGIAEFGKISSPLGAAQLNICAAVLSQDPSLYSYIQLENPFASAAANSLVQEVKSLARVVAEKDRDEFERRFSRMSRGFPQAGLAKALDTIYETFE